MNSDTITIVSGLPRSGTSMMMRMLEAGGMPVLTDQVRTPDIDNPNGYYEYERVKQIETDQAWLEEAQGHVVKMILALLKHLPDTYDYKIICMRRQMDEILASQRKMLVRRGEAVEAVSDAQMGALYSKYLTWFDDWFRKQAHIDVLYVSYNQTLADPEAESARINTFLGGELDEGKMVEVVNPALHRNRSEGKV